MCHPDRDAGSRVLFIANTYLADSMPSSSSMSALQEGDLIMTGTPAGVGEMKPSDKITVRMTSPGLDGEVVDELEWDCVQREGGYEFKG